MISWTEVIQNTVYFISLYYVVFWIIVLLDSETPKEKKLKNYPSVSIAIPAYNEEKNIVETIKGAVNLDYPENKLKIFIIDDGSNDKTYEKAKACVEEIKKHHRYRKIVVLRQKNKGKYAAMNHVLKFVDTEFFATLDADSIPEKDALKNLICFICQDKKIAAVSPVLKIYKPKNTIQLVQWFEYSINHFYKSVITNVNAIHVLPGPLSVYRTEIVKEVGCFREAHKTEDMEIAMRIQTRDYKIMQCNNAFVYTKAPYNLKSLYRQRKRWNYGTFKNLIDYRKMMFNKKYGDFGVFQLPVILLSGLLGITVLGLVLYNLWKYAKPSFLTLQMYNFNIIDYFRYFSLNVIWLDIDAKSIVTFGGFFVISIFIMYMALKIYREKYSVKSSLSLLLYLFFFYIFLAVVWLNVFKDVIFRRQMEWKK